jgi:hypothetical protein
MGKSDTELKPLIGERAKGESDNAVVACNDWLRLGTGRTLTALVQKYTETHQKTPPTQSLDTLKGWSKKFKWSERATAFDADYERIKNEERRAEMDYGAALDYERVRRLKRLADFLENQIYEKGATVKFTAEADEAGNPDINPVTEETYPNVWVHDVKGIGARENFERVDIVRFNNSLISEYRATLDDIAKEAGGRKQKLEGSIEVQRKPIRAEDLTDDELAALITSHVNKANTPD